MALTTHPI